MTDNTPCNFEVTYLTLRIGENSEYKHERYSYVVLKKGSFLVKHNIYIYIHTHNKKNNTK